jgi:DNA-binding NtrC family response regulator
MGGMVKPKILLVEDDPTLGPAMSQRLRLEGFDVALAPDGASAIRKARSFLPDLVLSDMRLPDSIGEDVFREITGTLGLLPYVFMTAFGEVQQAVRLVKAGARDYLIKPVDTDALVILIQQMVQRSSSMALEQGQREPRTSSMNAFEIALGKAARSDLPLLLLGETGVGKERAAHLAHAASRCASGPFVPLNCAALPLDLAESLLFGHEKGAFTGAVSRMSGVVQEADQGTLFLDEIAELPIALQPKLLRLLQERTYRPVGAIEQRSFGGRVIAATHRDLKAMIAAGTFREDLYFRLAVIELVIPPLRERRDEIVPLADVFLKACAPEGHTLSFSSDTIQRLIEHAWPGNIRELRNRIERAAALRDHDELTPADLFPERASSNSLSGVDAAQTLDAVAEAAIRSRVAVALEATGGNQTEAARMLGVSRTTVWKYSR